MRILKDLLIRALSSRAFAVMLALCALLPPLAHSCGKLSGSPGAGYVALSSDGGAGELGALLEDAGFRAYEDVDSLRAAVASGQADCGAVIPGDFGSALETGELEGRIGFISSPMSLTPELWRSEIGAAVFSLRAPYITAESLEGQGIDREEVLERYRDMLASGYLFSFDVDYVEGAAPRDSRAEALAMLAAGLSVFCCLMLPGCGEACGGYRMMKKRLGAGPAAARVLLPDTALRAALVWLFSTLGLVSCGMADMALPLALFAAALAIVSTALHLLLRSGSAVWGIAALTSASAPVLCPVFTDLGLILPWIKILRAFNMAYWLWPLSALFR